MRNYFLLTIFWLFSGGCQYSPDYGYQVVTPKGYVIYWNNQGSIPTYYTYDEASVLFDEAVDRAVEYLGRYMGGEEDRVRAIAHAYKFVIIDHARFSANASPTGYASGVWNPHSNLIILAFWSRASGNVVPDSAPPWTVYSWPQRPDPAFDWGVPPHYPALGHELGHAIWGAEFEHSWTPPLR